MKVISIIKKDLKTILSDRKALAIIILMPIILMTILSMALKGSFVSSDDLNIESINIAVVKLYDKNKDTQMFETALDNNLLSKDVDSSDVDPENIFFEDFLGSEEVEKIISYSVEEEKRAMELLDSGEVSAVVLLPERFIYNMKINFLTPFRNNVDVKILTHPDKTISGQIVESVMEAYTNAMSSVIIGKNVLIETTMANDLGENGFENMDDVMEDMSKMMENININIEDVVVEGKRNISSADYYSTAMMTMFILFAAGQGGRMLLEEKENQTYQRMIIAGTSKFSILSGEFAVVYIIALIQIIVMTIFSHFALKVQWGNLIAFSLVSLTAALAVAGLGAFVAAATYRAGNYKMASAFESAIIQVMALLGGSFFPVDVMPAALQKLSFLSLNGIALKAYLKIMVGYGLPEVMNNIFALAVIGVVFALLAVVLINGKGVHGSDKYNKIKASEA
ncbi:MAG: ABC transporter permease [Sedimentibacter sp.]|uniref:ABC transporter permease n=1 Tax=Sedimentibacter sp. TaxID=1960295 RepID=UPI0029826A81|nr:ABC transporter permease [Sedimentibacter sp.]MDW5299414.1 ABC transporter permease [Sedimentibacter sp.]